MALSANVVQDLGASRVVKKITCTGFGTTGEATGFVLPADCVVTACWIDVTTVETTGSTKTIDIGISADDDEFAAGLSVAAAVQLNSGISFPLFAEGGEEVYVNSNANALTKAVVDVFIEYIEQ